MAISLVGFLFLLPACLAQLNRLVSETTVDKLLARIGLTESSSEAARKRKEGAVIIGEITVQDPTFYLKNGKHIVRVGKKWKSLTVPQE